MVDLASPIFFNTDLLSNDNNFPDSLRHDYELTFENCTPLKRYWLCKGIIYYFAGRYQNALEFLNENAFLTDTTENKGLIGKLAIPNIYNV